MTDNLIEDIKRAESKAAEILDTAVEDAELQLKELRDSFSRSLKDLSDTFQNRKDEMVKKARKDILTRCDENQGELENKIAKLKIESGKKSDDLKSYILNILLG